MSEAALASLRAEGLHRHDPVRFHYLEALARRLHQQPPAVQQRLQVRWQAAVADYAGRARAAPRPATQAVVPAPDSLLEQLNRDLQARAGTGTAPGREGDGACMPDMKSVRLFGEVWSKISAEQQVALALVRGPENAGPLNSHRLMLRSLRLMRSLSPDYLRRFLAQMDTLLWLEQAAAAQPVARPVRRTRRKPTGKGGVAQS